MKLTVKKREVVWKAVKNLRKAGQIPWVIYWKHVATPINVVFDKNEFLKVFRAAWESTPVDLEGDGIKELVLIHGVATNFVTDMLSHVDFLAVSANEKVKAEVPVILVWESTIEKNNEWRIELIKDHVLVEALPRELPHDIQIDRARIATVNDVIFVRDLDLGKKVTIKDDLDQAVVTVISTEDLWSEEEATASESAEKTSE